MSFDLFFLSGKNPAGETIIDNSLSHAWLVVWRKTVEVIQYEPDVLSCPQQS